MSSEDQPNNSVTISVSYRGTKVETSLKETTTVLCLKKKIAESDKNSDVVLPHNLKLLWKGKVLQDDDTNLFDLLTSQKQSKVYKLVAMGVSNSQVQQLDQDIRDGIQRSKREVRDDLTKSGQQAMKERARLGRQIMLKNAAKNTNGHQPSSKYGFGKVEALPNLPNEAEARKILESLANDPGILACMAKHQWQVGSLEELYPDGKVGQSPVCVMGLNKNKGQSILLRLRTDDLKGFRKVLNIKKVLYHELAHNVHSEHDNNFFQLMRQIEKECNEMDWTNGHGLTSTDDYGTDQLYSGGTFRLGGGEMSTEESAALSPRELAARAAELRMTAEEKEIELNCGCENGNLFLPDNLINQSSSESKRKQAKNGRKGNSMDIS